MVASMSVRPAPLRIALVDDYEIVLIGVKHMFDSYRNRVEVADIAAGDPIDTPVDVALWDTFAQPEADANDFARVHNNPCVGRLVVYAWCFDDDVIEAALAKGAAGYLSKTLPAGQLVDALERIHRGEIVISPAPTKAPVTVGQDWPGRVEGLTERESEVVALITQGHRNLEIAAMTHLSINSIKTYIRSAYRKMGVASRSQAVLWGVAHGFVPPGHQRAS